VSSYRMVTRHVRYWRGAVHRWSTVYPFSGSISAGSYAAAIAAMYTMEQDILYDNTAGGGGGLYEIALYNAASGGVPVAVVDYFPYATPGSWIKYTSTDWGATTPGLEANAEAAMVVEWAAGLSHSGKPVTFKKWYHAVPSANVIGSAVQITSTQKTAIQTRIQNQMAVISGLGLNLGNSSRLAATTPVVLSYYGNHQMPRGRRRKALVTASGRYTGPTLDVPPVEAD
jgi:hypothetical protein